MSKMYVVVKENIGEFNVCAVTPDEEKAKKLTKYFHSSQFDHVWYEVVYPEWEYEGLDDMIPIWYVQWDDAITASHICRPIYYHHGPDTFVNLFHHGNTLPGKSGFVGKIAANTKEEAIDIYEKEWERREQLRIEYEQNHKKHRFTYDEIMPGLEVWSGVEEIKEEQPNGL